MSTLVNIIMYLWQLPQNIAGLVVKVVVRSRTASVTERDGVLIHSVRKFHGGVSLGRYVFCYCKPDRQNASRVMMAHEYGHSVQSRLWGWLYLPVVGLVSAIRCQFRLYKDGEYFEGWPERQADDLGGVKRDANGKRFV